MSVDVYLLPGSSAYFQATCALRADVAWKPEGLWCTAANWSSGTTLVFSESSSGNFTQLPGENCQEQFHPCCHALINLWVRFQNTQQRMWEDSICIQGPPPRAKVFRSPQYNQYSDLPWKEKPRPL